MSEELTIPDDFDDVLLHEYHKSAGLVKDKLLQSKYDANMEAIVAYDESNESAFPVDELRRVNQFANQLSRVVTDELLGTISPSSKVHIRAIIASSYNFINSVGGNLDQEMCRRAIGALASPKLSFWNPRTGSSEEAVEWFFQSDPEIADEAGQIDQERFAIFVERLLMTTLPLIHRMDTEKNDRYREYVSWLNQRSGVMAKELIPYEEKLLGSNQLAQASVDGITIVDTLNRPRVTSNEPNAHLMAVYESLNASAVSMGYDPVTGLSLRFSKLVASWEAELENSHDVLSFAERSAKTNLHEIIHTVSESDIDTTAYSILNELLTDTAANIAQHRSLGRDFIGDERELTTRTGYSSLVHLAYELIRSDFVTEDQIIEWALQQNPSKLVEHLSGVSEDVESAKSLVEILTKRRLLIPRSMSELDEITLDFMRNPIDFFEKEVDLASRVLGGSQISMPFHYVVLHEKLKKDSHEVLEIALERHTEARPDQKVTIDSLILLEDPDTGFLIPEALELFKKHYSEKERATQVNRGIISKSELEAMYIADGYELGDIVDIPQDYQLDQLEPDQVVLLGKVVSASLENFINGNKLPLETKDRYQLVNEVVRELYRNFYSVSNELWGQSGNMTEPEQIVMHMINILASWQIDWRNKVDSTDEFVEVIMNNYKALLEPIETEDGRKYPAFESVGYWGRALEINLDYLPE